MKILLKILQWGGQYIKMQSIFADPVKIKGKVSKEENEPRSHLEHLK